MKKIKAPITAYLFLAAVLLPALAMADVNSAQSSLYAYGWRIANFVVGISAILIIGDIAWSARDMTENGRRVRLGIMSLVLLAGLYGVAAFILGAGDAQGTTVSGIDTAMSMKP